MIKHIVVFRLKADASAEKREAVLAEYAIFLGMFPTMRRLDIGRNESARDQTFEYGFVMEFDDKAGLDAYLLSKEHEEHVVERFRPIMEQRAIVSFPYDPAQQGKILNPG